MFKGHRISNDETPKMLEMKEGDTIEAFVEQVKSEPVKTEKEESDNATYIKVKVVGPEEEVVFKVKTTLEMEKIFQMYCDKRGVKLGTFRFCINGIRILNNQTPKSLNMEDGDEIDAFLPQSGGNHQI